MTCYYSVVLTALEINDAGSMHACMRETKTALGRVRLTCGEGFYLQHCVLFIVVFTIRCANSNAKLFNLLYIALKEQLLFTSLVLYLRIPAEYQPYTFYCVLMNQTHG